MEAAPERFGRNVAVLIPAYEPDQRLVAFVQSLSRHFARIVLVNDGSTRGLGFFESSRPFVETIIVHSENRGKGAALKTALVALGEGIDVVTADADGQHAVEDVVRVAEALKTHREGLVLGVRDLRFGHIPFRSWWGNAWTVWTLYLLTFRRFRDTQTGLRGFPAPVIPQLLALPGDRYDYELATLASVRRFHWPVFELPIRTIYSPGNSTSHFSPIKDSLRNFRTLACLTFKFSRRGIAVRRFFMV